MRAAHEEELEAAAVDRRVQPEMHRPCGCSGGPIVASAPRIPNAASCPALRGLAAEEEKECIPAELEEVPPSAYATSEQRAKVAFITSVTSSAPARGWTAAPTSP